MGRVKKSLIIIIMLLMTLTVCFSFAACGNGASGESPNGKSAAEREESAPYGLYTDLQFLFRGENGYVSASVKNKFTLFPSTVTVNIELYRSDVYEESVANMALTASNYIYDLDQGETLTATASTEGKQSYWKARATYRVDNKAWKENLSETVFFNADGIKTTPPKPVTDDKEYFISDFLQFDAKEFFVWIDPSFNNIKESTFSSCAMEPVWLNNKFEFDTIKNLFGEIKLDQFDIEDKSFEQQQQFAFLLCTAPYHISNIFNDGSIALIFIDNEYRDSSWNANLFVQYFGENVNSKYFTATISDEANQALIDLAKNIRNGRLN